LKDYRAHLHIFLHTFGDVIGQTSG